MHRLFPPANLSRACQCSKATEGLGIRIKVWSLLCTLARRCLLLWNIETRGIGWRKKGLLKAAKLLSSTPCIKGLVKEQAVPSFGKKKTDQRQGPPENTSTTNSSAANCRDAIEETKNRLLQMYLQKTRESEQRIAQNLSGLKEQLSATLSHKNPFRRNVVDAGAQQQHWQGKQVLHAPPEIDNIRRAKDEILEAAMATPVLVTGTKTGRRLTPPRLQLAPNQINVVSADCTGVAGRFTFAPTPM